MKILVLWIPKLVFSDNGPEFASNTYKKFAEEWDFIHDTSSPEFPQSNGLVERTIQTVKKTLKKCFKSGNDPQLALLTLRTSPGRENSLSPAALLMNRTLRTTLPSITQSLSKCSLENPSIINKNSQPTKVGKALSPLNIGDHVRIHDGKTWSRQGTVQNICEQPRSYQVVMENGRIIRRNRRHLLRVPSKQVPTIHPYPDEILSNTHQLSGAISPNPDVLHNKPQESRGSGTAVEPVIRTKSGRVSRSPEWMSDYPCHWINSKKLESGNAKTVSTFISQRL